MSKCTLYKYMKIDYLEDVIQKSHLHMSDGTNFNDPFDLCFVDKDRTTDHKLNNIRVVSLTNSYRSKLMWSHYSDGHKGVCLTVELPVDNVYAICYSGKRVYEDSDLNEIINNAKRYEKTNLSKDYFSLSEDKKNSTDKKQVLVI